MRFVDASFERLEWSLWFIKIIFRDFNFMIILMINFKGKIRLILVICSLFKELTPTLLLRT